MQVSDEMCSVCASPVTTGAHHNCPVCPFNNGCGECLTRHIADDHDIDEIYHELGIDFDYTEDRERDAAYEAHFLEFGHDPSLLPDNVLLADTE